MKIHYQFSGYMTSQRALTIGPHIVTAAAVTICVPIVTAAAVTIGIMFGTFVSVQYDAGTFLQSDTSEFNIPYTLKFIKACNTLLKTKSGVYEMKKTDFNTSETRPFMETVDTNSPLCANED